MGAPLRVIAWGAFGIVVAVALSMGAFAIAGRSIGRPAAPISVAPSEHGDHGAGTPSPSSSKKPPKDSPSPSPAPSPTSGGASTGGSTQTAAPSPSESRATPTSSPDDSQDHEDN